MHFPRPSGCALLHVFGLSLTWMLDWRQSQPWLDGPARWPFLDVFVGDVPISVFAFGEMFGSMKSPYIAAAWDILGTLWAYFLGRLIEKRRVKA